MWKMSWRQGQTAILTQVLLTIAALLSHLGWSCSTVGHWGLKALCLPLALTFGILSPTNPNCSRSLVILLSYVHMLPLFFRLITQVHLLIEGSVEGQYITFAGPYCITNSNERTNALLYKYINLSHFIFERVDVSMCERWVGDGDRLLYWPQVLLRP